jgi:hypothetical protein
LAKGRIVFLCKNSMANSGAQYRFYGIFTHPDPGNVHIHPRPPGQLGGQLQASELHTKVPAEDDVL